MIAATVAVSGLMEEANDTWIGYLPIISWLASLLDANQVNI